MLEIIEIGQTSLVVLDNVAMFEGTNEACVEYVVNYTLTKIIKG